MADPADGNISLNAVSKAFGKIPEPILMRREQSRFYIALVIVLSLFVIVCGSFIILFIKSRCPDGITINDLKEIIEALISPVIGVVGAVTGFYFGERHREEAPLAADDDA